MKEYYTNKVVTIYQGDCREVSIEKISAIVTDPPYELGFMGKKWDRTGVSYQGETWERLRSYCLPGATLISFGGSRTQHRIACAIEDAGWEIRDTIMWVYGCLSEDTEVLTQRGYMPYHKLTKCDIIVVYDAENDIYKWESLQRWQVYRVHEDTIYRIRSDNTDQIVSRNHNCLVDREGALLFTKAEVLASMENMPILPDDFPNEFALQGDILLPPVQRDGAWGGVGEARIQGSASVDSRKLCQLFGENERGKQSSVERWCNLFQDSRQLCGSKVYPLSDGILNDGSEGRLCNGASAIGSPTNRATLIADRSSPPRQSRPDRQQSKNDALCQQQRTQVIRSGTSYKTTLARIYPERYSGIIYCPTVSTGAFVARRNGKVFITGNSGFPKSLDISKAIDKKAGAKREKILATGGLHKNRNLNDDGWCKINQDNPTMDSNSPATPEAKLWEGYGTALKPAYEPIILAMSPLDGTFANNALKHKVAGLNIDECRIPARNDDRFGGGGLSSPHRGFMANTPNTYQRGMGFRDDTQKGRFPSNFIHDGSQEVMELFPDSKSAGKYNDTNRVYTETAIFNSKLKVPPSNRYAGDSGSAARFFYCAKASRRERDAGLEDMPEQEKWAGHANQITGSGTLAKPIMMRNTHPCVKPISLMTYLCKLVKMPEYNLILDPFCGSGTTLLACIKLGIPCIGIDSDEKSCEIAAKRCQHLMIK